MTIIILAYFLTMDHVKVVKSWPGGSEKLFNEIWSSHISSYIGLAAHMNIHPTSPAWQSQLDAALADGTGQRVTFSSLLTDYLQGSGIPIPDLFADVVHHFNPIIDLRNVTDEGFRSRMFCWATTGSCDRALDASPIMVSSFRSTFISVFVSLIFCFQVRFVDDDDTFYGSSDIRAAMIAEGRISFKTCFCKALIPASYVIRLAKRSREAGDLSVFRRAIHHWLLCETLNAIGNHTVA
jgi:hypothetical protein